jgi:DnaJ-class molecular chaperone
MNEIQILRRLRDAMGITDEPGTCRDCGGGGVIPDAAETQATGHGVWQTCPTCNGDRRGGVA